MRAILTTVLLLVGFTIIGCATVSKSTLACASSAADFSVVTTSYQQATAPHRRAVRKPVRDARTLALRLLARQADALRAESESRRNAARAEYQDSLADLHAAAARSDLVALRGDYARTLAAYQRLNRADLAPN